MGGGRRRNGADARGAAVCVLSGLVCSRAYIRSASSALNANKLRGVTRKPGFSRQPPSWGFAGDLGPHSRPGLGVRGPGSGLAREGAHRAPAGVQGDSGPLRPHPPPARPLAARSRAASRHPPYALGKSYSHYSECVEYFVV